MKKFLYSMFAVAIAAMTFTGCADVPSPYDDPNGNTPGDDNSYLNETFAANFGDFTVNNITGTPWEIDYNAATATGYVDGTTTASQSYLVSPVVDLTASTGAYLQFDYVLRFMSQGTNKVLITNNYTGDPTTTTWTDMTGTLKEAPDYNTFSTYSVDVPADFIGGSNSAVVVALYYETGGTAEAPTSGTWEVKNLLMKEGKATGGGVVTPPVTGGTGSGTETDPYDVTKAMAIITGGTATKDQVYVSGTVVSVEATSFDPQFGSLIYYISDDGTTANQLEVYRGNNYNGTQFASADALKPGDKVTVKGVLTLYNSTAEFTTGSQLITLNGEDGGETPPVVTGNTTVNRDGATMTITYPDAMPSTETTTFDLTAEAQGWTYNFKPIPELTIDGTTISFAQETGGTPPTFYTASQTTTTGGAVRMYAKNSLTITGNKAIASVELTCQPNGSSFYTGNGVNETDAVKLFGNVNGNTWSIVNDWTGSSGGTQVRVSKIIITYAQ